MRTISKLEETINTMNRLASHDDIVELKINSGWKPFWLESDLKQIWRVLQELHI